MRDAARWALAFSLSAMATAVSSRVHAETPAPPTAAPEGVAPDHATPGSTPSSQSGPQPGTRITLEQAIQRALVQNVSVVVAVEEIRRAEALMREARSASLPTLTGNGIYTRLDADRTLQGRILLARDQLAANATLTVPLIVPQKWASWSHASTNVKTTRAAAEDMKRQTAIAVARAFLTVISQRHVIDVNEQAVKTSKAHFDYAHTRLVGGIGNRVDDVRAEQQLASDESLLETSYSALTRAREALGILLGDQGPLDAVEDIPLAAPPSFSVALDESTTKRADVTAGRARVDLAEQIKKDDYTDYLPFLVGTFQPFYQTPESLTQPSTGWQAQLILTIPFYDGGLRYGLADERASLSLEARAQYESLVRQARSDVRVAFDAVKRAEASLAAAVNAARLARSALDLAGLAYRAGATTNLEVIDAERAAHAADTAAAVAEDQAGQARIDLLAASGRFP